MQVNTNLVLQIWKIKFRDINWYVHMHTCLAVKNSLLTCIPNLAYSNLPNLFFSSLPLWLEGIWLGGGGVRPPLEGEVGVLEPPKVGRNPNHPTHP